MGGGRGLIEALLVSRSQRLLSKSKDRQMNCSKCGSSLRDHEERCPKCGTVMKTSRDVAGISVVDVAFLEVMQDERIVGRRVSERTPFGAGAVELREDASIHVVITGKARQGEEGTLEVCRILIARLKRDGGGWGDPKYPVTRSRHERGADCEAQDNAGNLLQIQITRAERDREFWARLSKKKHTEKFYANLDALTGTWRAAIEAKAGLSGRDKILLALDETEASAALPIAVDYFRERGAWARERGFREIWVVGASPEWTNRLDENAG